MWNAVTPKRVVRHKVRHGVYRETSIAPDRRAEASPASARSIPRCDSASRPAGEVEMPARDADAQRRSAWWTRGLLMEAEALTTQKSYAERAGRGARNARHNDNFSADYPRPTRQPPRSSRSAR